jgi:hypothetical protein
VKTRECNSREYSVSIEDVTADVPESSVYGGEIKEDEILQSLACELNSILLPDFTWGTFSEVGGKLLTNYRFFTFLIL